MNVVWDTSKYLKWKLPPRSYAAFLRHRNCLKQVLYDSQVSTPIVCICMVFFSSPDESICVCDCARVCIFKADHCAAVVEIDRLTLQGTCGTELLPFYPEQISFGLSMFTWKRNLETLQVMFGLCNISTEFI